MYGFRLNDKDITNIQQNKRFRIKSGRTNTASDIICNTANFTAGNYFDHKPNSSGGDPIYNIAAEHSSAKNYDCVIKNNSIFNLNSFYVTKDLSNVSIADNLILCKNGLSFVGISTSNNRLTIKPLTLPIMVGSNDAEFIVASNNLRNGNGNYGIKLNDEILDSSNQYIEITQSTKSIAFKNNGGISLPISPNMTSLNSWEFYFEKTSDEYVNLTSLMNLNFLNSGKTNTNFLGFTVSDTIVKITTVDVRQGSSTWSTYLNRSINATMPTFKIRNI